MAKSYAFLENGEVKEYESWPGTFWIPQKTYCIMSLSLSDHCEWLLVNKSGNFHILPSQVPKHIKMQALVLGIPLPKE